MVLFVVIFVVDWFLFNDFWCGFGSFFDLLSFGQLLVSLTLLQDVKRIRILVKEKSVTISDTYSVGILHFEQYLYNPQDEGDFSEYRLEFLLGAIR